jgi:hypothetical protein
LITDIFNKNGILAVNEVIIIIIIIVVVAAAAAAAAAVVVVVVVVVAVVVVVVVSNTNWNILTHSSHQRAKSTGTPSRLNCIL